MPGEKLLQVIRSATQPAPETLSDMLFGEVTSIAPLKIKVDSRFEVGESFLILSPLCQAVGWWRGLQVGDSVLMIRFNHGQLYYVVQRKEGLTV